MQFYLMMGVIMTISLVAISWIIIDDFRQAQNGNYYGGPVPDIPPKPTRR